MFFQFICSKIVFQLQYILWFKLDSSLSCLLKLISYVLPLVWHTYIRFIYLFTVDNIAGVKAFTLPLSEFVSSGRWFLYVEVESSEFSAPIEIAPGVGNGLPDVAAAEEHYVELRFGREMRRRYKPGLPFSGKVR